MSYYAALITYPSNTRAHLMVGADGNYIRSDEENRPVLVNLVQQLLNEHIISSAQIVMFDGPVMEATVDKKG